MQLIRLIRRANLEFCHKTNEIRIFLVSMREICGTKHGMAGDFWIVRCVKAMSTPNTPVCKNPYL